jgi:hypothetical protein
MKLKINEIFNAFHQTLRKKENYRRAFIKSVTRKAISLAS